jgi:hypothetical protein
MVNRIDNDSRLSCQEWIMVEVRAEIFVEMSSAFPRRNLGDKKANASRDKISVAQAKKDSTFSCFL